MIATGIKAADIKIPVVVGDHEAGSGLDVFALSSQQPTQQAFIRGDARFVDVEPGDVMASELFMKANQTV